MIVGGVNLSHYIYPLADTQSSRHYGYKMFHQTNQRLISDFDLCDLAMWVKTIADIAKARSQWTASMVLFNHVPVGQLNKPFP